MKASTMENTVAASNSQGTPPLRRMASAVRLNRLRQRSPTWQACCSAAITCCTSPPITISSRWMVERQREMISLLTCTG